MDDATLSRMMQAYAEDGVDHERRFGVNLDYREDSIKLVEQLSTGITGICRRA